MAQSGNNQFAVTISAKDRFSPVFASLDRAVAGIPRVTVRSARETDRGVAGLRRGFEGLQRAGTSLGQTLGAVVEPLKGTPFLGAELTFAGLAAATYGLTDHWAKFGQQVLFTSQNLGIGVEKLQAFQGGARLAGASAQAMTSGLGALRERLYGAAWGRDPLAIATFRQLDIAVNGAGGHIRKVTDLLPELANAIAAQKDPAVQAEIATRMFGAAGYQLLPYLRLGAPGIAKLNAEAERHGILTKEQTEQMNRFVNATSGLGEAVEGLGKSMAADLAPPLTQNLDHLTKWIDGLRQSKTAVEGLKIGGEALAGVFGLTLFSAVVKLTKAVIGLNVAALANPFVAGAGVLAGVGALEYFGGKAFKKQYDANAKKGLLTIPSPGAGVPGMVLPMPKIPDDKTGFGAVGRWFERTFGGGNKPAAPAAIGAKSPAAAVAKAPAVIVPTPAFVAPPAFARGGIVPAAARGWEVPSVFGTDTVPAMLTPGEMVLPRDLSIGFRALIRAGTAAPAGNNAYRPVAHRLAEADYEDAGRAISAATGAALRDRLPDVFARAWRRAAERLGDTGMPVGPGGQAAVAALGSWLEALRRGGAVRQAAAGAAPGAVPNGHPVPTAPAPPAAIPAGAGALIKSALPRSLAAPAAGVGLDATKTAFLGALAHGESGGRFNVLYGGSNFADFSRFPTWAGRMGPAGISHAAGAFQFEPATFAAEKRRLGLPDFSPGSQMLAAWDLADRTYRRRTGRDLESDLAAGDASRVAPALNSVWTSLDARFGSSFAAAEKATGETSLLALARPQERGQVVPSIFSAAGGGAVATATDTRHHVQIDVNAPPGTRAGIREAEGPAEVGLRVRYAMGPV